MDKKISVGLVAPFPPPYGGMSVLASTIKSNLEKSNQSVKIINTNPFISLRIKNNKIVKILQLALYLFQLRKIVFCDIIVTISSSGSFFYVKALPALFIGKFFRKPVVLDFVGGGVIDILNDGNLKIVPWIKKFDLVLVPTAIFKNVFTKVGIESIVFPNMVDIERFNTIKKKSAPIFLAAKSLDLYSNVSCLVKAFAEIKKHEPLAQFLIAGQGPEKNNLEKLINELNLSDVIFLGNKSYEEMPDVFSSATIFLHGTKHESFGIVLVEAMASATPVISTNVGGIPELIENGKNGILVDYDDHFSMASAAIELLRNKNKYQAIVENGLKTSEKYSGEKLTNRLITLLKNL